MRIVDMRCAVIGHSPVVRIITDEGIVGHGEAEATKAYLKPHIMFYKPYLLGMDPTDVARVMLKIRRLGSFKPWGSAVSAIEMALWDIAGKAAGLPVYKLLGGKVRDQVRIYNGGFRPPMSGPNPEDYADNVAQMKAAPEGFDFVKMGIGFHSAMARELPGFFYGEVQEKQAQGWSVFARKGFLSEWRGGRQVASIDLRPMAGLPGAHNHQNACAAYATVRALGLAPRQIEAGLASFTGLPHRSQLIGERDGVRFVNDSKATNVDSAAKALQAFPKLRWIAGGLGKEGGISALTPFLGAVSKAYLIGHSARDFALQLGQTPYEICETMDHAVARAAQEAQPGEVVLLAPAAASFDQYPNFEKRGDHFAALVRDLIGDSAV